MRFKHTVTRKNQKSRYKTGVERDLSQLLSDSLFKLTYI